LDQSARSLIIQQLDRKLKPQLVVEGWRQA